MTIPTDEAESMVERVAKAIYAVTGEEWGAEYSFLARNVARDEARAAIEAMREPTPAMLAAVLPVTDIPTDEHAASTAVDAVSRLQDVRHPEMALEMARALIGDHRKMIDAALTSGDTDG